MPRGGTPATRSLDAQVGANVRAVRTAAGRPMKDIAALLGVTVTQVSECERGHDRLGAGALLLLAKTFGVRVSRFYEGVAVDRGVAEEGRPFEREGAPNAAQKTLLAALAAAPLTTQRRAIKAALKALETPEA